MSRVHPSKWRNHAVWRVRRLDRGSSERAVFLAQARCLASRVGMPVRTVIRRMIEFQRNEAPATPTTTRRS